MRKASIDRSVELAMAGAGPAAKLAAGAVEVGIIVPSILVAAIKKAGFKVGYYEGPEEDAKEGKHPHGAWVRVADKEGNVIARAYSHDEKDAILQAWFALMLEEDGAAKAAEAVKGKQDVAA